MTSFSPLYRCVHQIYQVYLLEYTLNIPPNLLEVGVQSLSRPETEFPKAFYTYSTTWRHNFVNFSRCIMYWSKCPGTGAFIENFAKVNFYFLHQKYHKKAILKYFQPPNLLTFSIKVEEVLRTSSTNNILTTNSSHNIKDVNLYFYIYKGPLLTFPKLVLLTVQWGVRESKNRSKMF